MTNKQVHKFLRTPWVNCAQVANILWKTEIQEGRLTAMAARARLITRMKGGTAFTPSECEIIQRMIEDAAIQLQKI